MLLVRGSVDHPRAVCALLLLCFCVFMQMPGAPMALCGCDLELDAANTPFLEEYSLPTVVSHAQPSRAVAFVDDAPETLRYVLHAHSLFRPPNSLI